MNALKYLLMYLLLISVIAVGLTLADKRNARLHRRRIPERTLFLVAFCGGSAAMWITMRIIRHKTLHKRFMLGLPILFLAQAAVLYWLIAKGIVR